MKPSWLIGDVLKKCGVPCAYEIGMMLAQESDEPVIPDVPDVPDVPDANSYLTFASAEPFTLAVSDGEKHWDGTLYYTTDLGAWSIWHGSSTLVSAKNNSDEHRLYLRGIGNSKIVKGKFYRTFDLTGKNVHCRGNIENLLDFEAVANGQHPIMSDGCFDGLFRGCTSLVSAPELPATNLSIRCYEYMFCGCTSLVSAPELPATTLAEDCYRYMFDGCTSLVSVPELPATNLADFCYAAMFRGCTSLVALPKLPATNLSSHCYEYMFDGCTSIKVSTTQSDEYHTAYRLPSSGAASADSYMMQNMFRGTGGTFTGDPQINSTYYTSNEVI